MILFTCLKLYVGFVSCAAFPTYHISEKKSRVAFLTHHISEKKSSTFYKWLFKKYIYIYIYDLSLPFFVMLLSNA